MNSVCLPQHLNHIIVIFIIVWYCMYFIDELWFITTDQFVVPDTLSWNIKYI